jgi:hypothetical protein
MWLLMADKTGLSAKGLCDVCEFGSYQTAWIWLHKLRSVMIRKGRECLQGRVEIDEAYIGGKQEGPAGRGAEGKTLVLVAVEGKKGKKLGRVRFRCLETITQEAAESFINLISAVEKTRLAIVTPLSELVGRYFRVLVG